MVWGCEACTYNNADDNWLSCMMCHSERGEGGGCQQLDEDSPSRQQGHMTLVDIRELSTRDLKGRLASLNVNTDTCLEKEDLVQALYGALARKSGRGDGENDGGDYRKRKATDDEDGDSEDDKFSGARGGIRALEAPPFSPVNGRHRDGGFACKPERPFSPLDGRHQDGGLTCIPARSRNTGRRDEERKKRRPSRQDGTRQGQGTDLGIKQRNDFNTKVEHRDYVCSGRVVQDRMAKSAEFKQIAKYARSHPAYEGGMIGGEQVDPRKLYYEQSLQYYAQVNDKTKVITNLYLKCPKSKKKGGENLATCEGGENCDSVMSFRVFDQAFVQNNVVTRDSNSSTRRINQRPVCIPGGECGCKDVTKAEAKIVCDFENMLAKYAYDKFGVKSVCANGGGASVEKEVMPNLHGEGTLTHQHGWHLSTFVSKYSPPAIGFNEHVYRASLSVERTSDFLRGSYKESGILEPPPRLFDLACSDNTGTGMVQAVTHLVDGETIPGSLQRLFDCAREAHRVACSRHGRKSWEYLQERSGGREGAILVLKEQQFFSKGGKARMAMNGVNYMGQKVAAVRTAVARHHDIDDLTSQEDEFLRAIDLARGLMDIRTRTSKQAEVLVECLIDALPDGFPVTTFEYCSRGDSNYTPNFLGKILAIEVQPLNALTRTTLKALIKALESEFILPFFVGHFEKKGTLDLTMLQDVLKRVMMRIRTRGRIELYECPCCPCQSFRDKDAYKRNSIEDITGKKWGYNGEQGCGVRRQKSMWKTVLPDWKSFENPDAKAKPQDKQARKKTSAPSKKAAPKKATLAKKARPDSDSSDVEVISSPVAPRDRSGRAAAKKVVYAENDSDSEFEFE